MGVLATAGCTATQGARVADSSIALAEFGPADSVGDAGPGAFYLGAGDTLGYAIFVKYVAYVRANDGRFPQFDYATAEVSTDVSH